MPTELTPATRVAGVLLSICYASRMKRSFSLYLGTTIFGITDGIVSTVGLLAGITVGGASSRIIVLTGVVYAFVEAFSMAVGNFLSEESTEEYAAKADVADGLPIAIGLLMFAAFTIASLLPLAPYLFLAPSTALLVSIAVSFAALFIAGVAGARLSRLPLFWRGMRMALLGGFAILLGIAIGRLFPGA